MDLPHPVWLSLTLAQLDRYYYGLDDLFKWHPDIVHKLTTDAPDSLVQQTLKSQDHQNNSSEGEQLAVPEQCICLVPGFSALRSLKELVATMLDGMIWRPNLQSLRGHW